MLITLETLKEYEVDFIKLFISTAGVALKAHCMHLISSLSSFLKMYPSCFFFSVRHNVVPLYTREIKDRYLCMVFFMCHIK